MMLYKGMLPTPSASDIGGAPKRRDQISQGASGNWIRTSDNTGTKFGAKLNDVAPILMGILPTPNARDWKDTIGNGKDAPSIGVTRGYSLGQKLNSMLPTPATRDYKGANSMEHLRGENGNVMTHETQLPNYIKLKTGSKSQLNPRFVAEMMGFPPNWTELPFLSGEQNQSKDMETP